MSAPVVSAQDCCSPCLSSPITNVPGPAGAAGAAGTAGSNGLNAFTTTSAGYTQPAVAATVSVAVASSAWAVIGQVVYVQNGGYYTVTAIADSTHLTLRNLGYSGNAAPAAVIGSGQRVGPGGLKGTDGVAVGVTFNSISPTTTRGDIIVDNGANAPLASDVRLAAGTDGQQLTALAAQPTGLIYRTITPNAATDNVVPRFDASGATTPTPLQSSGLQITDTAAIQTTAGNARGTSAVDLQPVRGVVTQVASGNNSTIAGGLNNTASGARSSVGGGTTNQAIGPDSHVGGGDSNTANAAWDTIGGGQSNQTNTGNSVVSGGINNSAVAGNSTVGGGTGNTANATSSSVGGGQSNTASGASSVVAGGTTNTASGETSAIGGGAVNVASASLACIPGGGYATADKYGQLAHANGRFSSNGDAQVSDLIWRITTTDATANVEAFLDGVAATKRATVPNNTTWAFVILVSARASTGVSACWEIKGGIRNNGGATALVAAVTTSVIADGTGATWGVAGGVTVDADDPNDTLRIRVTGAAATTIRWSIAARIVETGY